MLILKITNQFNYLLKKLRISKEKLEKTISKNKLNNKDNNNLISLDLIKCLLKSKIELDNK